MSTKKTRRTSAPRKKRGTSIAELRIRLEEAEDTLRALRSGEVDAIVTDGPEGSQIFTLQGAERSYRILVEAMKEGAATLSASGLVLYANQHLSQMLRQPLERVTGRPLRSFFAADDQARFEALLAGALGGDVRGELRLAGINGATVPVYLSLSPMATGDETNLCAVVTDLAEQKRSQETLAAERLARSILEQAAEVIIVCDERGRIVRISDAAACYSESPLFRPFTAVFPFQGAADLLRSALGGESVHGVTIALDVGGERKSLLTSLSPLRAQEGQILGCIITMTDVTQLKAVEAHLQEAVRAKDEFLAILGHELRNPLAPILTALHLMRLRGADRSEKERTVIERQAHHLVRLVDDLLDVSRITQGKVELKKERVEAADVVAAAIEMASPLLEQRQHRLAIDVPHPGIALDADPERLAQVISNLLTNAAKYTEEGGRITVAARLEGGEVVISVSDSGIGIPPEMLPRVFEMFVQERQALDRSQGGLGLGLTIVRALVSLHGGSVSVHSEGRDRGSEFVVRLPAAAQQVAGAPPTAVLLPVVAEAEASGKRILVVDDNEDAAEMLSASLELMGHKIRVAHDGPAALKLVDSFAPELALLDIGLPAMDGYELARRLRVHDGLEGICLVAVTGYGQPQDRERSRAAGFDAHLVKPVSPDQLESMIEELTQPN